MHLGGDKVPNDTNDIKYMNILRCLHYEMIYFTDVVVLR